MSQQPEALGTTVVDSAATPTALPEPTHFGIYEILEELGCGGMGVVSKARQTTLDRVVALKTIRADRLGGGLELARFQREAEALARVPHPNVVAIYEIGEEGGQPYFSMEYVAGGSLAQRLRDGPLDAATARRLVEALARAVHHAHVAGVVHRDLKPANVLLAENDCPKVGDFGLAKKLDDVGLTVSGQLLGTPAYMSPEQAEGRDAGPPADIHALGTILYECLTGRSPFRGPSVADTLDLVRGAEPVPPTRLNPRLPRDLETICLKCLHKDPARRYASALDLAEDLRRFGAGEPIQARPASLAERGVKWARRHRARTAAAALGVALVVAVAVGGWLYGAAEAAERRLDAERSRRERENLQNEIRLVESQRAFSQEREQHAQSLLSHNLFWEAERFKIGDGANKTARTRRLWEMMLQADQTALERFDALVAEGAGPRVAQRTVQVRLRCGNHCQRLGRAADADRYYEEALQRIDQLVEAHGDGASFRDDRAAALTNRGNLRQTTGRFPEADADYRAAEAVLRELNRTHAKNPKYLDDLASILANRAGLAIQTRRIDDARALLAEALALRGPLAEAHPDVVRYRTNLGSAHFLLGDLETGQGRTEVGIEHFRRSVEALEPVVREQPDAVDVAIRLAMSRHHWGAALRSSGRPAEALPQFDAAVTALDRLLRHDPQHGPSLGLLPLTLTARADLLTRSGKGDKALADWERARGAGGAALAPKLWAYYPHALVGVGKLAEAVTEAEALRTRANGASDMMVNAAAVHSLVADKSAGAEATKHAARAVELLREARGQGAFADANLRAWVETDPEFASLRRRPEYEAFAREGFEKR